MNVPTPSPDDATHPNVRPEISGTGLLLTWPASASFMRLHPETHQRSEYYSGIWIINLSRGMEDNPQAREDMIKDTERRNPNGIISLASDCAIVAQVLENIHELRYLSDQHMIGTMAFERIYANMTQLWKVSHSELTLEDAQRFDYTPQQMEHMIKLWMPLQTFTPEIREWVADVLRGWSN